MGHYSHMGGGGGYGGGGYGGYAASMPPEPRTLYVRNVSSSVTESTLRYAAPMRMPVNVARHLVCLFFFLHFLYAF